MRIAHSNDNQPLDIPRCWSCKEQVFTDLEANRLECFKCFAQKDGPYQDLEENDDY